MAALENSPQQTMQLINSLQDINFLKIVLIVLGIWLTVFALSRVLPFLAERGPNQLRLFLLGAVPISRLLLLTLAIVWIVPLIFNVTFQNFLVIAGAASVAVGFAFKDYISSLIAGIVAVIERPYRPGDWITVDGDYGEVLNVGMRAIRINTAADNVITIPHDKLWTSNISNSNDGARTLQCVTEFYLDPDHDGACVRAALQDVALTSAYLEYDQPVVVVLQETPWGTHYKLRAYPFDMRDQFLFISDLTVRGKQAIAECGGRQVSVPAGVVSH